MSDPQFAADAVSDEDLIAEAPSALRQLAAKLVGILDEDHWNNIEPYLLDTARLLRAPALKEKRIEQLAQEQVRKFSDNAMAYAEENARLRQRIEQLEAALREIAKDDDGPITMAKIARAALAPEQEK